MPGPALMELFELVLCWVHGSWWCGQERVGYYTPYNSLSVACLAACVLGLRVLETSPPGLAVGYCFHAKPSLDVFLSAFLKCKCQARHACTIGVC